MGSSVNLITSRKIHRPSTCWLSCDLRVSDNNSRWQLALVSMVHMCSCEGPCNENFLRGLRQYAEHCHMPLSQVVCNHFCILQRFLAAALANDHESYWLRTMYTNSLYRVSCQVPGVSTEEALGAESPGSLDGIGPHHRVLRKKCSLFLPDYDVWWPSGWLFLIAHSLHEQEDLPPWAVVFTI